MERKQAHTRITAALEILRIRGWTTGQRERLVDGLALEDAVETAEREARSMARQQPYHANVQYDSTAEYAAGYRAADLDDMSEPVIPADYTPEQATFFSAGWQRAQDDEAHATASEYEDQ